MALEDDFLPPPPPKKGTKLDIDSELLPPPPKKKEPTIGLGYEKPSEALRMGGLPKQEKLSQSPLKTAATTTPSVSTKRQWTQQDQKSLIEKIKTGDLTGQTPEEDDYLSRIGSRIVRGMNTLNYNLSKTPEFVYNLAAYPQNVIAETFDIPALATSADKVKKELGIQNEVADYYKDQINQLASLDDKYMGAKGSVTNLAKEGKYLDAAKLLGEQIAESLPTTAVIAASGGLGASSTAITLGGGAVFGAAKYDELADRTDLTESQKASISFATGLTEGLFENLGTGNIGRIVKDVITKQGAAKGKEVAKGMFITAYKDALKKYMPVSGALQGGIEEAATAFAQNAIDIYTGVDPNKKLSDGLIDAFAVGTGSDFIISSPVLLSKDRNKKVSEKQVEVDEIDSELNNPNLSDDAKATLTQKRVKIMSDINDVIDEDVNEQKALPDEAKREIEQLQDGLEQIGIDIENTKSEFAKKELESKRVELENRIDELTKTRTTTTDGEGTIEGAVSAGTDVAKEGLGVATEPSGEGITGQGVQTETVPQTPVVETKPSESISTAADSKGVYIKDGEAGVIRFDGQSVVFETNDKIIELGNKDELAETPISEFGIEKEELLDVKVNEDNSVVVEGVKFVNNFSNPQAAINTDADGNVVSVNLETEDGKKRTIRGQRAEEIAYQYKLKEFEQNATEESIARLEQEVTRLEGEAKKPKPQTKKRSTAKRKQAEVVSEEVTEVTAPAIEVTPTTEVVSGVEGEVNVKLQKSIDKINEQRDSELKSAKGKVIYTDNPTEIEKAKRVKARVQEINDRYDAIIEREKEKQSIKEKPTAELTKPSAKVEPVKEAAKPEVEGKKEFKELADKNKLNFRTAQNIINKYVRPFTEADYASATQEDIDLATANRDAGKERKGYKEEKAKKATKAETKKTKPEEIGEGLLDILGIAPVEPAAPAKKAGKTKPVNVSNKSELAELEDQAEGDKKTIIEAAKKGIATLRSIFPDMEIYIHEDPDSYNETMSEVGGVANSRGNFAFERDANDNPTGKGRIDINLSNAKDTTVAHELVHAVLLKEFGDNPAVFKVFRDRMSKILRADLNEQVTAFEKLYSGQDVAPEEYLTELAALLSQGGETVEYKPSTLRRVAALINEFVSKITKGKFQPFRSEVDFKNFVDFLNQISGAIRVGDVINNLNNKEAYSSGASIPMSDFESFVAKKVSEPVKSKSQIGDYKFPDKIKILKTADLPIKNLTDLVREYKGKVVIITSDATGYGVDKNGDPIFGGFGFSANAKNVNDGIGFASVSIGTVKGTYTAAEKAYGEGKALVLVMIQPPHTTINNSYGSKYIIRGIKEIATQSKEELAKTKEAIKEFIKNSTAIQNELKTNEASLKRGSEKKLIELIDNIDENTDLDSAVEEFIADTTFTIRKELGKGIILENKDIRTNKSTNYAKIALNNAGYNIFNFLKEYGDNTFLSDEIILNNTGGFVVGGFELDVLPAEEREKLISETQSKGIVHPLFNAKLPGTNHFRLDGLYDVQENFSEYVRPETVITLEQKERDKLVRKYYKEDRFYSAQYRSIPLSKRTYTQLTIPAKTEFKEKYLKKKGALIETIPNIGTKVAKGEGFIPKPGAAEQMAKATMVSKSQRVDKASDKLKQIFQRDNIPLTIAEAKTIVEEVYDWTTWYDGLATYVYDIFGEYSEDILSMLPLASMAANSSSTVGLAINNAEKIYRGEKPSGVAEYYGYVTDFLEGKGIKSDKMSEFFKALTGNKDAIAVDMHVYSIIMGKNPNKKQVNPNNKQEFDKAKEFVRTLASELDLAPREVQAALWAANILRTGGRPDSYEQYFKKQIDEKGLKERIKNWRNEGYKPFSEIRKDAEASAQKEGATIKSKGQLPTASVEATTEALKERLNPDYKNTIVEKLSKFDKQIENKKFPSALEVAEHVLPRSIFNKYKALYELAARNNLNVSNEKLPPNTTAAWAFGSIQLNKDVSKYDIEDYNEFAESLNHEIIHGLISNGIKDNYALFNDLQAVMNEVINRFDSASDEVKNIISYIQDVRSEYKSKDVYGATDEEFSSDNYREIGDLEELITYAFTNKEFADFLDSIPASKKINVKGDSIFQQLKNIIRGFISKITKSPTALDEINFVIDKYFDTSWNEKQIAKRNEQYEWGLKFKANESIFDKYKNDPELISKAYHKGDNPKLNKAVDELLSVSDIPTTIKSKAQKAQNDKIKDFIDAQRKAGQSDKDIKAGLELVADKVGLTPEDINNLMGVESDEAKPLKGFKPKDKAAKEPEGEKTGTRAFAARSSERAGVPIEDIPASLRFYSPTTVEEQQKIAEAFIRKHGIDNTITALRLPDSGIDPKSKPVLASVLLKELYAEQGNTKDVAEIEKIAIDVHNVLDAVLTSATEAAQFMAMMREFYNSNPYNYVAQVTRLIEKNINNPIKANVATAVVDINKANKDAAAKAASNVVNEVVTSKVTSAKEKFERSKANLKALWKKSFNIGIASNQYEAAKNDVQFAKALTIMAKDFVVYQSVQFSEFLKEVAIELGLKESDIDQDHLRKIFEKAKSAKIQEGIKVGLKELELKLKDLIESHYSASELEGKLIDKLKKEFGVNSEFGLNDAAIKELEEAIKREIKVLTAKEKIKALKALGIKEQKDVNEILSLSEEGLLNDNAILETLGDKLGIKKLTAEEAAKLADLAKDIKESKEDRIKARNIQKFEDYKFVLAKKYKIQDFLISNYLTNIFGSLTSNEKNIAGNVSETILLVGELMGNALASGNPKDIQRALKALVDGNIRGFDFTKEVLTTGVASYKEPGDIRARNMWELIMDRENDLTRIERNLQTLFRLPYLGPTLLAERRFWNRALLSMDSLSGTTNNELGSLLAATREADKQKLRGAKRTKFIEEQMANSAEAQEEARNYAISAGYKEGTGEFNRAVANYLVSKRPEAIKKAAAEYSARATLTQTPPPSTMTGAIANGLNDVISKNPNIKFFVPVVNTFANLIVKNIERSPFEFFSLAFDAGRAASGVESAKAGLTKAEVARRMKTAAVWTAISVLLFALAGGTDDEEEGFEVFGSGTGDPAVDNARRALGWKPNTVRFSKDGGYYNFEFLPFGFVLGMIGNMRDYFKYKNKPAFAIRQAQAKKIFGKNLDALDKNEREQLEAELAIPGKYNISAQEKKEFSNLLSELASTPDTYSFQLLKSLGELVNAVGEGAGAIKTALKSITNISRGLAAPRYLGEVRDIFDNKLYDTKEFRNVIGANVPFVKLGNVKLDAFGREIEKYKSESILSGIKYALTRGFYNPPTITALDQFLWENGVGVSVPSNTPSMAYTEDVYREYIVTRGKILITNLTEALKNKEFEGLSPQDVLEVVNAYTTNANAEARSIIDEKLDKLK